MTLIRSSLYVLWLYGWMFVMGVIWLPSLVLPRALIVFGIRTYARLVVFGARWICGIKVELRGQEHIPVGPILLAGKHQAMLDVFIPFLIVKDPLIVMKRELLWYPILGWYAVKSRQLWIDRAGGAKTMRKMLKVAREEVHKGDGRQMLIYPEGTRVEPGAAPHYQPAGVRGFYKALEVPLVPLATNAGLCWPAHGLIRRPGTIVYEALPPIEQGLEGKGMMARLERELEAGTNRLLSEGHGAASKQEAATV